jgi:tripartite ATP-independent transporter DctP family solute receptor
MQQRRTFLKSVAAAALWGAAAAGKVPGITISAASAATRTLRLGHWTSIESPHHAFAVRFAELVAAKTAGAIEILIYPAEALGSYNQQVVAQQTGTLDFSLPTSAALARIDPRLLILTLPYLFGSASKAYAFMDTPLAKSFFDSLPRQGIRVLALSTNGMRNVTNSRRPILRPEDMAGLRIRVPQNGVSVALFRSFGADPVAMPFSQVYKVLKNHSVDGQENPYVNIYTGGFYKCQQYLSVTHHQFEGLGLVVSERTWTTFDTETKDAMIAAAREAAAFHRARFDELDTSLGRKLEQGGMQFSRPELAPFRAKSRPLYRQLSTVFSPNLVRDVERAASA